MNILQIGSYLHPDMPGGAEFSALNVASALKRAGHEMVELRWRMSDAKKLRGSVERVGRRQWVGLTWRPYTPLETRSGIKKLIFYGMEFLSPFESGVFEKIILDEKINAIIIHSFRGMGYDILAKIALLDVPTIVFIHDYALTCINKGRFRRSKLCMELCKECRLISLRNRRSLENIEHLTFIGPSRRIVEDTRQALGMNHGNFLHIPNPNEYQLMPRARISPKALTLGYFGRLEKDKGVDGLLQIADSLNEKYGVHLVIAGAGDLTNVVQAFAEKREWVRFHGFVPSSLMVDVYNEIDVLLVPSLWPENFPGVLVQALGNGIPAIGFDTGGIPEIIRHGETGLLVPVGDFGLLGEAVGVLTSQPELFESMSLSSLDVYREYDPGELSKRIVTAIEAAVK